jgi:hypothetical protein
VKFFVLEISDLDGWFQSLCKCYFSVASNAGPCPSNGFAFLPKLLILKIAQWLDLPGYVMDHYQSELSMYGMSTTSITDSSAIAAK